MWEPGMPRGDESILLFLVPRPYFLTIAVFHHSFLPVTSLQSNFEPRAILSSSGSRTSSPSWSLGAFTTSHLTRRYFFVFDFPTCQRNFLISYAEFFFVRIGTMREENWKIGREERIKLIRTRRPIGFNQIDP